MAAPPKPERDLDDVLAAIDEALPKIHRKRRGTTRFNGATNGAAPVAPSPAPPSCAEQVKRSRLVFQAMADDPILIESGEDKVVPE